ncbi:MAG: DNA repair protein RadA [Bacteriovoracaceae bacterium]
MAKSTTSYVCQNCSYIAPKWLGKCPECGQWNSFLEEEKAVKGKINTIASRTDASERAKLIKEIEVEQYARIVTKIDEFDRVMGNGLVKGSLTLIGGEPGIGKSTLLMEISGRISELYPNDKVLYVSGEESEGQVASRSKRLGINTNNFYIFNETNWQTILEQIKSLKPKFFVLDSIQTTISHDIQSAPGTISQIREVTYEIMNYAKSTGTTCFIIGHVTKEGSIAGPKILEHMVDTVIYFEGDQFGQYRLLRAMKNRFGNTNEVGIFEMKENGLNEVKNPSQYFLDSSIKGAYGRSLTCIVEGTRSLFIEIQALVVDNKYGNGRRTTQGVDSNRLAMLVAVMEKYFGIPLSFSDIYLNVVGGMKLSNRESDLSMIASILSSHRSKPLPEDTVFIGEVGLTGEVRSVPMIEVRIKEMAQMNYKKLITSAKIAKEMKGKYAIEIVGINRADEIADLF